MSRFVSGGTSDGPTARSAEWLAAQSAIESAKAAKAALNQPEAKSLYDTLQANKAAKQEAFDESIKLKHQFRALDDDEIDFLESLTQSERAAEATRKREEAERLAAFKEARERAEKEAQAEETKAENDSGWEAGRKRKRERKALAGVKAKKAEAEESKPDANADHSKLDTEEHNAKAAPKDDENVKQSDSEITPLVMPAPPTSGPLGLVGYGSDSDDD